MAATHISDTEAARDLAGLLARARSGEEIIIESGSAPPAMLCLADSRPGRTLSEALRIAEAREAERGYPAVMDEDFAADIRDIRANRRPRVSQWD